MPGLVLLLCCSRQTRSTSAPTPLPDPFRTRRPCFGPQDEPPRLPIGQPAVQFPPGAMPGMTYRYEQAVRPLTQITQNAESARLIRSVICASDLAQIIRLWRRFG